MEGDGEWRVGRGDGGRVEEGGGRVEGGPRGREKGIPPCSHLIKELKLVEKLSRTW
jgi:hypothetical protein